VPTLKLSSLADAHGHGFEGLEVFGSGVSGVGEGYLFLFGFD
jgi:hypothetical protein